MKDNYKKNQFAEILKKYNYTLHSGDIVAGTIKHNEKIGFLVDIGTKKGGYLPKEELLINVNNQANNNLMLMNTTRDFFLITENKYSQQCILSIKRLDYIRAWKRIKQIYSEDIIFYLTIKYLNKGGIITYLEGIQGFIPKSHQCFIEKTSNDQFIKNNIIQCKILTINENKNQLILSNKSAQLRLSIHKFKIGELSYGKIIMLKPYGLFININSIKALLHISETGNLYNKQENKQLIEGKFIKVKIIHINTEQGKISLSIKKLKNIINHHQQY
uniref:Ribosomal protein S1 n=1 Tax=Periphykon beckeri TaxID=2006982 RepID=A0A1Z1M3Y9_9FLOR|nr:ribosomal protein S1 [Periphykon beckeri]ARW60495.1 ribosomal protein S1 [Periphykon beckeri]